MHSDHSVSTNSNDAHHHEAEPRRMDPLRIAFWLFLGAAAFYLIVEHRAHVLAGVPWLPFLILAACPLIHVFGHGGHGHHHRGSGVGSPPPSLHQDRPPGSSNTPE